MEAVTVPIPDCTPIEILQPILGQHQRPEHKACRTMQTCQAGIKGQRKFEKKNNSRARALAAPSRAYNRYVEIILSDRRRRLEKK